MSSITRTVQNVLPTESDVFPAYSTIPAITSYVSGGTFNNTYYVDFANGNDTNSGTSYGSPWKTLNHALSPGDLVYTLGGTHMWTTETGQHTGDSIVSSNGTSSNYIVIAQYPSETTIIEVDLTHSGSSNGHPGGKIIPIQITGNYIVLHGLTFAGSGTMIGDDSTATNHVVIQGCTCLGHPSNLTDEQQQGAYFLALSQVHDITIQNNDFDFTDTTNSSTESGHSFKMYSMNGGGTSGQKLYNITFSSNRNYGCASGYGVIAKKAQVDGVTVQHNLFYQCLCAIGFNLNYNAACTDYEVSYNACINPGTNIQWLTFGYGAFFTFAENLYDAMSNCNVHDNVLINSSSNIRFIEHGSITLSAGGLGDCYNNVIADCRDAYKYSAAGNEFDYCDYNAYISSSTRDTFDNLNSVAGWQTHCVVNASLGITTSGTGLNCTVTASASSPLRNAGRGGSYNPHIAFSYS